MNTDTPPMRLARPPAEPRPNRAETGGRLAPVLEVLGSPDLRRVLPMLALAALFYNLLALALPLAILQIFDRVILNQSLATLALIAIGVFVALVLEEVLRGLNNRITGWLGARFEHSASVQALERLMGVPMRRFQKEEPGVHAERVLAAPRVADFYSGQALLVLFDLPFVLIFLALIWFIGGWLVIVPVSLLLLFTLIILRSGHWMREQVRQRNVLDDRRHNFLAEVLRGIHSVKTLAMESLMQRRYERLQAANAGRGEELTHGSTLAAGMGLLFSQIMTVAVVFAGAVVVVSGAMTPGGLAACMMLAVRSMQPLRRSLSVWLRYQSFLAAQARLHEVEAMPSEDEAAKPAMPPLREGLDLRDIEIGRSHGPALFSGLSLRVRAGQCIAIQGESGSGKTSLLSLMNGIERPDSGEALVDGRPVTDFSADSLHREIAFLPQTGTFVAGTILENMTMFDPSLNAEALRLAQKLGLDRTVAGMKLGYETPIGDSVAEALPVGVRQLIAIIRAVVRGPSVILFDEANIALDLRSDKLLRDYLEEQKGRCTIVLVTHRPSLLSLADTVYHLADGRLHEGAIPFAPAQAIGEAELAAIPARPERTQDLGIIIGRQFNEVSDLSLCLPVLLDALNWSGRPRDLAEALPHMVPRLDLSDLCSVLANLDHQTRHFATRLQALDNRLLPCLFITEGRPARVVLERLPGNRLRVYDSALAAETEIEAGSEAGEAYLFQPIERNGKPTRTESGWFADLVWRFRRHIALAFFLTVVSTLLTLAAPLFVMSVYDRVLPSGELGMGAFLLLGALIALGLDWQLRRIKSRVMAYIGGRAEYIMGSTIFQRVLSLPSASTESSSVGRQVGRIKNFEGLREFFLGPLALVAFELPANLVLLVAIGLINPSVLLVIGGALIAFLLLGVASNKANEAAVNRASQLISKRWEFLNEALTGMRSIRAVGAGGAWVERFRGLSGEAAMAGYRASQVQARIGGIAQVMGTLTGFIALVVSALQAIGGQVSGGAMIATMMIVWRLVGPIQSIFLATTALSRIRTNMRQIENLMRLPGERDSGVRQTTRPETRGELSFSRVSFRYSNDADPALLGVSFAVQPGQVATIAGPNGSGKSTILKLIVRAFVPQAGTIRLDNVDIRQLTGADLRAQISYMPQNCELFYGTVRQNLLLAHPAAREEEVRWAVDMAGLTHDILALPEGFDTRISDSHAEQLPHGFRQRLSLARTLLKPASVVLMDEPGNGMDDAGEQAFARCIEYLRGKATVLIVSHRPSHMRQSDVVIYMERGSLVAMAPFDQLKDKIMSGAR